MVESKKEGHVCPYHEEVKRIQDKRDSEMVRVWGAVAQRLSTSLFLWIFGIAFTVLLAVQGVIYTKIGNIEVSTAGVAVRLDMDETQILKNEIRYENLLKELTEHKALNK